MQYFGGTKEVLFFFFFPIMIQNTWFICIYNKIWQMPTKSCIRQYSYQLSDQVEVSCVVNRAHSVLLSKSQLRKTSAKLHEVLFWNFNSKCDDWNQIFAKETVSLPTSPGCATKYFIYKMKLVCEIHQRRLSHSGNNIWLDM